VLRESTARLVTTLAGLDDTDVAAPSSLRGWTRGHVLTHVARNADGLVHLVAWAGDGQPRPMYASPEARTADIEAGAARPATALRADVEDSAARLDAAFAALATADPSALDAALSRTVVLGAPRPGAPELRGGELVRARRREVEIHHADLDAGYGPADWPEPVADEILRDVAAMRARPGGLAGVGVLRSRRASVLLDPDGAGLALVGAAGDLAWWVSGRAGTALVDEGGSPAPSPVPW
jgi:maleylpyruvate isomerase